MGSIATWLTIFALNSYILPAAAVGQKNARKKKLMKKANDTESDTTDDSEDEPNEDSDEVMESDSTDDETLDPVENVTKQFLTAWKSLSPPVSEDEIKMLAKDVMLIVGKSQKRFLEEKDGAVYCMEIKFLKPNVGLGNLHIL